ncbi:MAG TPA: energy transducer TonB [Ideonella sp.]|nr:energy transducer TonB [Ideonella sp.]
MTHLARHLGAATTAFGLAALLFHPLAMGQSAPAPAASAAGAVDPSVSERIKKDAASPLYWIRLNAQKADSGAKPAGPRIVEIKPAAPAVAARPAPPPAAPVATAGGGGNSNAAASNNTAAITSSGASAGIGTAPDVAAAPAATLPVGTPAGANLAGTAAASLVAPAAPSATEAARAATQPPVEEPEEPLALIKANEPEFPVVAMRRLRKGTVQVRFEVQPDGRVGNITVVQTSNKSLNDAAIEAVNSWVFKPVRSPRAAVVDLGFDLDG